VVVRFDSRALISLHLVLSTLILGACGGSSGSDSGSVVLQGKEGRPDVRVPDGQAPSKLVVVDLEKGGGTAAKKGVEMSVRYFSFAYQGHEVLEDHWRGRPTSFRFGSGETIPAWEKGLLGLKVGGRRELILPPKMSSSGSPEVYVVDAISIVVPKWLDDAQLEKIAPTGAKPSIAASPGSPPTRLVVRELKKGTGGRVGRGERLGARFIAFNYKTKQVQDFWEGGLSGVAPYSFALGQGEVRKGWEIAIPGQRLGTRLELLLPSRLAYGDGPMRYVVELLEREKRSLGR
jgi:FKBP-type peptidyl-prolyl cis-trans isomerase